MAFDSLAADLAVNIRRVPIHKAIDNAHYARVADTLIATLRLGISPQETARIEVKEQIWAIRTEVLAELQLGNLPPNTDVNEAATAIAKVRAKKRLMHQLKRYYSNEFSLVGGSDSSTGTSSRRKKSDKSKANLSILLKNLRLLPIAAASRVLFLLAGKDDRTDEIISCLPKTDAPAHAHSFEWQVARSLQKAVEQIYVKGDVQSLGKDAKKVDPNSLPHSLGRFLPIYIKRAIHLLDASRGDDRKAIQAQLRVKQILDFAKQGSPKGKALSASLQKAALFMDQLSRPATEGATSSVMADLDSESIPRPDVTDAETEGGPHDYHFGPMMNESDPIAQMAGAAIASRYTGASSNVIPIRPMTGANAGRYMGPQGQQITPPAGGGLTGIIQGPNQRPHVMTAAQQAAAAAASSSPYAPGSLAAQQAAADNQMPTADDSGDGGGGAAPDDGSDDGSDDGGGAGGSGDDLGPIDWRTQPIQAQQYAISKGLWDGHSGPSASATAAAEAGPSDGSDDGSDGSDGGDSYTDTSSPAQPLPPGVPASMTDAMDAGWTSQGPPKMVTTSYGQVKYEYSYGDGTGNIAVYTADSSGTANFTRMDATADDGSADDGSTDDGSSDYGDGSYTPAVSDDSAQVQQLQSQMQQMLQMLQALQQAQPSQASAVGPLTGAVPQAVATAAVAGWIQAQRARMGMSPWAMYQAQQARARAQAQARARAMMGFGPPLYGNGPGSGYGNGPGFLPWQFRGQGSAPAPSQGTTSSGLPLNMTLGAIARVISAMKAKGDPRYAFVEASLAKSALRGGKLAFAIGALVSGVYASNVNPNALVLGGGQLLSAALAAADKS